MPRLMRPKKILVVAGVDRADPLGRIKTRMDNNSVSTKSLLRKNDLYIILPTFIESVIANFDWVNIA